LNSLGWGDKGNRFWGNNFQPIFDGKIDTWDVQWVLSSWVQGRLAIIPQVNMISNIGFGQDATHTTSATIHANMSRESIRFPLEHPGIILSHTVADNYSLQGMLPLNIFQRLFRKFKSYLKLADK
jgi:hypothetical protein